MARSHKPLSPERFTWLRRRRQRGRDIDMEIIRPGTPSPLGSSPPSTYPALQRAVRDTSRARPLKSRRPHSEVDDRAAVAAIDQLAPGGAASLATSCL